VVNNIYARFKTQQGLWNGYVSQHLIPRINGFEILMASYAVAHLKLEMLLQQTGYKPTENKRLRIYLTNSLEEAHDKTEIPFAQWLSDESNEASSIKRDVPVMVVLGNPPYSVSSQNKGKWIQNLMGDYKKGLNERNIQPLSDDYIKFIRFGQHFINKNRSGILSYISNNSFIDGLIHRQMRKSLLETFDRIYILNLHGNAKKKETAPDGSKDENVFDIQQGVSINIFVKNETVINIDGDSFARVFYHDLYGTRKEKYSFLLNNNLQTVKWQQLKFNDDNYFFVPKDFSLQEEYEKGFKIDELFVANTSGITTANDNEFVDFKPLQENNYPYTYHPVDFRFINYNLKKIQRGRYEVMQHFTKGNNIGLCLMKRPINTTDFKAVFVSNKMIDGNFYGFRTHLFPLYLYQENFLST
jgi:predicted helicase